MSKFFTCGGVYVWVALLQAAAAQSAIINIDRPVTPADFTTFRRETDTLEPGPGTLYQDFLRVNVSPSITVNPGDTIQFHIRLQAPFQFSISPGAGIQAGFEFLSNAPSTYTNTNLTGGPVTLDNPENIASNPTTPLAGVFLPFSNPILALSGGTSPTNAALPSLFNGFSGAVTLPDNFPTTTFDRQLSFEAVGAKTGIDPPPPLARIVPEPTTTSLAGLAAAFLVYGRHRR